MSPIATKLAVLALATSALAFPFAEHGKKHEALHKQMKHHPHHFRPSGSHHHLNGTGAPYGVANATGVYGTAASTGFSVATGVVDHVSVIQESEVAAVTAESTTCTDSIVSKTVTNRKTVYVTTSGTAEASSVAESTEETSMTLKLLVKQYSHWHQKSTSTTEAAAATTTSAAPVAATSTSTKAAATTSSTSSVVSVAAVAATTTRTSSAAASTSSSSASTGAGKRGVAYNTASLTVPFEGASEVTWGYNWGQSSSGLSSSFNYVPLLWGASSSFTSGWSAAAQSAIDSGSTHLMSFNEPDLSSQSDLTPAAAAAAYMTYMQPFAGKALLGAPAVTNGGGADGLDWLAAFLEECSECTIDFVAIHWYDSSSNAAYFQDQVANATAVAGGKPVWVTEFGCTDGTDAEISSFLETVMPWMDEQSYVQRYSYFMVADGYLLSSGTTLSSYGSTYMSYTS